MALLLFFLCVWHPLFSDLSIVSDINNDEMRRQRSAEDNVLKASSYLYFFSLHQMEYP